MQKIEAVIQPSKPRCSQRCFAGYWSRGDGPSSKHAVMDVKRATRSFIRGREYTVDLLPKIKLETVVPDELLEKAVQASSPPHGQARSETERSLFPRSRKPSASGTENAGKPRSKGKIWGKDLGELPCLTNSL